VRRSTAGRSICSVSSIGRASFVEERRRPNLAGTRPSLMRKPWVAVANRPGARYSVECRGLRDPAADPAAGRQPIRVAEGCGRAAATPRTQVLVRSGVQRVSKCGWPADRCGTSAAMWCRWLLLNCVFGGVDGPGAAGGVWNWTKGLDGGSRGCESGSGVSIAQGCDGS